ncbi:MAG: hypothetical protein P1U47_10155 [Zhongshania sp.]|uniref:hypothetical protein n=1 Tax=Zhongshania sp. TaxID=1971902 RepID=UPI00263A3140|nr:hypothetical protein [Zhongshania sp.]MDF1692727.1 hypothetical protein [Zhongshania sp.]
MTDVSSPRAKLVEMLWQLKLSYDKQGDKGVRYIHFNTLLNDPDYRRELIEQAAVSSNAEIRELGLGLRRINIHSALTQGRHDRRVGVNPDIAETVGYKQAAKPPRKSVRKSLFGIAVLLLGGLIGASFFSDDLKSVYGGTKVVSGSLHGELLWTNDKIWVLDGIVYVEAGARLVIEAGTTVQGRAGSALLVTRDGTIQARGTATKPIVFTSAVAAGKRRAGDWGGLVLLGNAPVNTADAQIEGLDAGDTRGMFGGVDATDNCGVLEYARIEFAGYEVYANNELNGLTLGGCGSKTIIRNVQVHRALDDGIEIFGGSVDLRHILITGAADDSLDWDMGWTGRVQFLQIQQYPSVGDNAFEADNDEFNHDAGPVSEPTFYNVTLQSMQSSERHQRAMTLRRGTGGHFYNMVIDGFSGEAIDIKDRSTVARIDQGLLSFGGLFISDIGSGGRSYFADEAGDQDDDAGFDEAAYFAKAAELANSPQFVQRLQSETDHDYRLAASSPARNNALAVPQGEFWDEAANYRGAFRPGVSVMWTDGWTDYAPN